MNSYLKNPLYLQLIKNTLRLNEPEYQLFESHLQFDVSKFALSGVARSLMANNKFFHYLSLIEEKLQPEKSSLNFKEAVCVIDM